MRKVVCWAALALLAAIPIVAFATGGTTTVSRARAPLRAYVGATPQQYDTLFCPSGGWVVLKGFHFWADDSAQTPVLNVVFMSQNSKTIYAQLREGFTANLIQHKHYPGFEMAFPRDSTILVYYNITGATPGTLDTLITNVQYYTER